MPPKIKVSCAVEGFSDEAGRFRQSVSEADIDWLLCVELNTNREFQHWVGQKVLARADGISHLHAWRSVPENKGESDLLWLVQNCDTGRIVAVLIENKINARSQPRQHDRYVERGQIYRNDGVCDEFVVVLAAPEEYTSKDSDKYGFRLSYEQIRDWFALNDAGRSKYLAWLFDIAINKSEELADVDDEVLTFRRKVWELASAEFPHLNVSDPRAENVSSTRYIVYMRTGGCTLAYKPLKRKGKFFQCAVDLELRDPEIDEARARKLYGRRLEGTDISIRKAGGSVAFRRMVPFLEPPKFDAERVRIAMRSASELVEWWRRASN